MSEIAEIYRSCKKKKDINWFTEWLCRPVAAVLVFFLRRTPITPNQVSFLSLLIAGGAGALFAGGTSYTFLLAAVVVNHISFIFDCSDGMLARCKNVASHLGHLLDFLMDELKAMLIFACVTVRMWRATGDEHYLLYGIGFLFALATGLTLTSFVRRPEYSGEKPTKDGQPAVIAKRTGVVGKSISLFEHAARSVVHYPQYIWILAICDRIDIYFWAYGAVNVLYIGRVGLAIAWRLGRFRS
ncbi:MAG: CDP-alcohol phosphatidyltransferase family protein [Myxococcales bacterium]|nr:CDP-alcohol phosphatidyltransferase family protein [Myxococcales bacterium]